MNIDDITDEISRLEQSEANWNSIEKLANLYVVRDHMLDKGIPVIAREVHSIMPDFSGEFGEIISGRRISDIVAVLSEHMAVVKILHPKEYQAVLDRISEK